MRARSLHIALSIVSFISIFGTQTGYSYSIKEAKKVIADLHYERANEILVDIALNAQGSKKQEALLLLARLKSSSEEAEMIYQEVIDIDPKSNQAKEAYLELAKIAYALGKYRKAYDLLSNTRCEDSSEACFLRGLCAFLLEDFASAQKNLYKIDRGKFRAWADLILAEIEKKENKLQEACKRYQNLSRTGIIPAAIYRFAECKEREGNIEAAAEVFREIIENFSETPEAVLADEKLKLLSKSNQPEERTDEGQTVRPISSSGYTIQFGAFKERRNALKLADDLKKLLPKVRIDVDIVDYRELHRVRYGYFQTREDAAEKAKEISKNLNIEATIMKIP